MSDATVTPAGPVGEPEGNSAHAGAMDRVPEPPETAGYWRIQAPLTREPRMSVAANAEAFAVLQVYGSAIAYCMARPGSAAEEAAEAERAGQRGSAQVPPGRRGWRWQWPARHVPAGCRLMGQRDYQLSERALVDGIRRGLRERAALEAERSGEVPAGER